MDEVPSGYAKRTETTWKLKMKLCSILGCPFPGWVYFGNYDIPSDEDAPLKTWKETCFLCNGEKYILGQRCICDDKGQVEMFDHTCATEKVQYQECIFHFGVLNFIYYDLICKSVNQVKKIITRW